MCIQYQVTDGKGRGFGLYMASEFIKKNRGKILIHSGNAVLVGKDGHFSVQPCSYWQGTYVMFEIDLNFNVDYSDLFKNIPNFDYNDLFDLFLERNGIDSQEFTEDLW